MMLSSTRPSVRPLLILLLGTALLAGPRLLSAGTTGDTGLYTPQGSTAGTSNGDYVSDTSGMNSVYRYFIEVPPGLGRLVVEIFDADIGLGGASEDTSGRDRDRGGSYTTTATYGLYRPNGAAQTTNFVTGSLTAPVGSDNTWLTFFDSSSSFDDVRDNFGTAAYNNNDGTLNWTTSWAETNDNNSAGSGKILITGGELRLGDNGSTGASAARIEREADLSSFTSATLSFDRRTTGVEAGDQYRVEVSSDGGANWNILETWTGSQADATESYDISAYMAANTRIRFIHVTGYVSSNPQPDYLFVDNLRIQGTAAIPPGHWELRVDMNAGDDINAIGIRAHDGDSTSGGTELNVYFDSHTQIGANPPNAGTTTRNYTAYPYITSGCTAYKNDFDYDRNRGNVGSMTFTSPSGAVTQSFSGALELSVDDEWLRGAFSGWTSDVSARDYGLWSVDFSISSYLVNNVPNGNYTTFYVSNYQAADPSPPMGTPPAANPTPDAYRVYLPTDAGAAPVKPYLEQVLAWDSGPNPPVVGQTTRYSVTVRLVNPTPHAITFSASNLVTANIPGSGAVYEGTVQVSQGSVVSAPASGGTGNITWNPGTVAAGETELLFYRLNVTPASPGQRIVATGTPTLGTGTRATFVDETGNTTQSRATFTFGPLCELAVTQGLLTQAMVSSFKTFADERGGVLVEWTTASEAGTAGFRLLRWDASARRFLPVHGQLLPGLIHEAQGGTYRFHDGGASPGETQTYLLEEVEAGGRTKAHGPFSAKPQWERQDGPRSAHATLNSEEDFARAPHQELRRKPGRIRTVTAPAAVGADGAGVHLSIRETGLYYLPSAQIAGWLGMSVANVETFLAKGKLALTRDGAPVAWYPDVNAVKEGKIKGARGLFFYGEADETLYSRDTVYRLRPAFNGQVMQATPLAPATVALGGSFLESRPVERDAFAATAISPDPESDYWFWDFVVSGNPTYGHRSFAFDAPALASGGGTIEISLHGGTDTKVAGEHRASVAVNGTVVGETQWQGIAPRQETFAVPAGVLLETGNQVEITGTVGGGAPYSIFYVDGFRIGYPRQFKASGDQLAFTADSPVTATGFSNSAVRLLDVTDPLRPLWITGAAVAPQAGSYGVSFHPSAGARYFAAGPAALKTPVAARAWTPIDLRATDHRADVLIVVPAGLKAPAERLAEHRRDQGLEALVVDLDEVADGFGGGIATPHALRDFLAYAYANWAVPPSYAVLVGEGSLDYRNLLGYGDCVMPPLLVRAEGGLFPADNRLADFTGDGQPEIAVGRIPVLTAAELDAYVDKILDYESQESPAWASSALMLADSPDGGASFSADSDRIVSQIPGGYTVDRIYLDAEPIAQARARLMQGIASGASLINFVGHGGLDRLSGSGLLTSADVAGLTNGDRLPVLTAMTCTVNRFAVPGVPALGELLVKSPAGGAAAVWGPSGLSFHGEARHLAELFYRRSSEADGSRLGDWILRSMADFRALGGDGLMLDIYNLLGDPALSVRRGPAPAETGGSSGE